MHRNTLKPKINTIFFILLFDLVFIIQGDMVLNDAFIYITFLSFFLLVLSYFTNFLSRNRAIQKQLYTLFVFIGFPVLSSFIVFYENFQIEAIFVFFVQTNFYIFYVNYIYYIKSVLIGIISGFALFFCTHNFCIYTFSTALVKPYTLFFFSLLTSIFLWKTIYSQFLIALTEREKEVEDNITMIVHELNSPLVHINVCAQNLRTKFKDDVFIEKGMASILRCVERAFFQIQFRKENLRTYMSPKNTHEVDIKNIIEECVTSYMNTTNERIHVNVYGPSFFINADINFLYSFFTNLLNNSCFFIKKSGKGSITIKLETLNKTNRILFRDTGYGIKPDILPMIFDKGFSRRRDGTGMGLYMCRELIHHLGGTIRCESVFGEFTDFIIAFPRARNVDR